MPKLISVGQLIDSSWEHYRTYFVELMSISLWLLVPTAISILSFVIYPSYTTLLSDQTFSNMETAGVILWIINSLLIGPVVGVWILTALLRLINGQLEGKRVEARKLAKESWKLFWPMVFVNILVMLILIGAIAFVLPGGLLLRATDPLPFLSSAAGILFTVGILLATFFGIRWLIFFAYAPLSVALEDRRGRAALKRSHELVRGKFWSALARMVLPKVIFVLVMFVIQWLLLSVSGSVISSMAGLNIDIGVRLTGIIETIIFSAGVILLNPIIFAADVFLYSSLRETLK